MSARGQKTDVAQIAVAAGAPLSKRRRAGSGLKPKTKMPAVAKVSKARKARLVVKSKMDLPSEPPSIPSGSAPGPLLPSHPVLNHSDPSFPAQGGQREFVTLGRRAALLLEIRETHRRRQDFHRAEKSLTLQIKAIERRLGLTTAPLKPAPPESDPAATLSDALDHGNTDTHALNVESIDPSIGADDHIYHADHGIPVVGADPFWPTLPLVEARATVKKHRLQVERALVKLAKKLPVWPWVEAINGFGPLGLAQIAGEAGDLANYANPGKLWKRFGLAVFHGKSQRRVAGAAAIEQGYSPTRRAIMFCIGDSLLKKQNPYRELYLARKILESAKVLDGTKMLWHRRAQRYAEKRLLKNLWQAWRM